MAVLDRLCPAAVPLRGGARMALSATLAIVGAIVVATAVNAILGVGGRGAEHALRDWGSSAIYVLVALAAAMRAAWVTDKRRPWAIFAAGLCAYGLGNVLWSVWVEHLAHPPIPSVCDGLWLAFYPLSYVGILGFARSHDGRRVPAGVWLDGIIAGAGLAAVGAALVFEPVLSAATGNVAAVATELAYPIGDLLLAALLVGILAVRGWRVERAWRVLGAGFIGLSVADCLYAVQVAHGASTPTAPTNLVYVLGTALLGVAAWQPTPTAAGATASARSTLLMPAVFTLAAVGLLQYDHVRHLDPLAFTLADVTLGAALIRGALGIRDIRGLAEARRQADTDHLTSLPNRRSFMTLSHEVIERAGAQHHGVAVLMIDLDNFKELNDTLGHGAGDLLLSQIGPRLRDRLRGSDIVARLGGDEFAVVLRECDDRSAATAVARGILGDLRHPFAIAELPVQLTASIGIALFPADGDDASTLLARADIAMYQAKRARRGCAFYSPERDTHSPERLSLAADLAGAIDRDELEVHFQPKARTVSRSVVGVEALVRWRREPGGPVSPPVLLDAAEQAGLSRAVTGRVLDAALGQLAAWRGEGIDIHVAVNTTVADLLDLSFPDEIAGALGRHGLEPASLVLEVTESSVLTDPERIGAVLQRLCELGVTIALDDFGTGYSSLSHLVDLPVGELKIDRSFVAELSGDGARAAVVEAMIRLAGQLGMRVVAEGVEDDETWSLLRRMGCDCVQGYGLSRPQPAGELTTWLRDAHRDGTAAVAVGVD